LTLFDRNKFEQIIRLHKGRLYRTAGLLFGFFSDPETARSVATEIAASGVSVVVYGCQIMITL
jgi:hypothetical protein